MPHLTIQCTQNIQIDDPNELLNELNKSLWQSGQFSNPSELKARILPIENYLVGTNQPLLNNKNDAESDEGFIYLHLKLLSGRSDDIKNQLSQSMISVVQQYLEKTDIKSKQTKVQVCVEIEDISPCYHKLLLV